MKIDRLSAFLIGCLLLLVARSGQAGVIISNGLQTTSQATGAFSNNSDRVYDNFTLPSSVVLRSVRDWQIGVTDFSALNLGNFTFQLFTGSISNVGALVPVYSEVLTPGDYSAVVDPILTPGPSSITNPTSGKFFRVSFDLGSALPLLAGNYVFTMFGTDEELRWANVGTGDGFSQWFVVGPPSLNFNVAGNTPITFDDEFLLASPTVPEPASLVVWTLGAVGIAVGRVARRSKWNPRMANA